MIYLTIVNTIYIRVLYDWRVALQDYKPTLFYILSLFFPLIWRMPYKYKHDLLKKRISFLSSGARFSVVYTSSFYKKDTSHT